jgi:hypothetical protein
VVAKDVDVLPVARGTVLEAEAEEVADIRGSTTAELNGESGAVVGWRERSASLHDSNRMERDLRIPASSGCFWETPVWAKRDIKG